MRRAKPRGVVYFRVVFLARAHPRHSGPQLHKLTGRTNDRHGWHPPFWPTLAFHREEERME